MTTTNVNRATGDRAAPQQLSGKNVAADSRNRQTAQAPDLDQSNSLADLAARIRAEHEATIAALQSGVVHAMAAGDLLIEAKAQLPHGQWLAWLRDHCAISERMAQRYMRLRRNRAAIEAKADTVSDLGITGALALLSIPRDSEEPSVGLTFASVETLIHAEELEDALRSLAEREKRKPLLARATANMDRIGELVRSRALAVAAEALGEKISGEIQTAAEAYVSAISHDEYEAAHHLARKLDALAAEWLRHAEAAP